MGMWLAALEAEDGSWSDDPLPTDGLKDDAISNAQAMWPTVPAGHRIALYSCDFVQEVEPWRCEHEWIDIRNSVVQNGSMCRKCQMLRSENVEEATR